MTSAAVRYCRSMTSSDCPRTGRAIRQRLIRTHARGWTSLPSGLMGGIVPQLPAPAAEAGPKAMNLIIGILVVFGCVLGGFAVHGGHLGALWQPSEPLIIANPLRITKRVAAGFGTLLKGAKYKKEHYLNLFAVMYELLSLARKEG